jgi:DNA-binding NtrC family response regulator
MSARGKTIIVVEDRETIRMMVEETLSRRGYAVRACGTAAEGKRLLEAVSADLLLTDLQLPDGSGLDLLVQGLAKNARLPVLVMSAYGTIGIAVEAMKLGAYDFITKPFDTNRLVSLVGHALERRPLAVDSPAMQSLPETDAGGILGESAAIHDVIRQARKVAPSEATVLILGESGTGKELVARAIHRWSGRSQGPLIPINCAAIPRDLMEAELFGSEKGSFTGAVTRKIGKIELSAAGTFFLDEVAELPGELQAKLLRILQERTFMRIGGTQEIQADIRVIAATNKDLAVLVREGKFREDLYYRLNVFPIHVPALRERTCDILPLAAEFARQAAKKLGKKPPRLARDAADTLLRSAWPGNVRQLENAIERAVILAEGEEIRAEDLQGAGGLGEGFTQEPVPAGATLLEVGRHAQRRAEVDAIRKALAQTEGNKTEAARLLGVSYKTLWSKLKEYEVE